MILLNLLIIKKPDKQICQALIFSIESLSDDDLANLIDDLSWIELRLSNSVKHCISITEEVVDSV